MLRKCCCFEKIIELFELRAIMELSGYCSVLWIVLLFDMFKNDKIIILVQLNLHETDVLFRYLSHHLTFKKICRNLQHMSEKLFFVTIVSEQFCEFRNNNKNNYVFKS